MAEFKTESELKTFDPEKSASSTSDLSQSITTEETPQEKPIQEQQVYITGWRFHLINGAMLLGIFLVNLEITIISTSLVSISNDLHSFERSSWIVNAYMVTFTGFNIILAKLSDIFGRKICVLLSLAAFTIFSGACGAAQTMTQLIILRAMQGIGGAGASGILRTMFFELVPPTKYASITGVVSAVYALCFLAGPLLGGIINERTTWRWIFLINVPCGVVTIAVLLFVLPKRFPNRPSPKASPDAAASERSLKKLLIRIDYLGIMLLLAATALLVTALEESSTSYSWGSAPIICMLVFAGLSCIAFLFWSWWRTARPNSVIEPAFPWRLVSSRSCMGMLLLTTVAGAPLLICSVSLPLRFQSVNRFSPLQAGIHLLPFSVLVPVGSVICSILVGRAKIPSFYLMLFGSLLQVVGLSLLGWASPTVALKPSFYGYQIITGFGIGIVFTAVTIAIQYVVEKQDKAVGNSAIVQFRLIGGAVGLAVVTTVFNSHLRSHLAHIVSPSELSSLLSSTDIINTLSQTTAEKVRSTLVVAYNLELRISAGFSIAQVATVFLLWTKRLTVNPR